VRREAVGILPPGMMAYSPEPKALSHDPARARLLLKRAGYDTDHPAEPLVLYTTSTSAAGRELLDSLASDLDAIGIELQVRAVDWTELTDRIETGRAPAFLLAWIADMNDPDAFLRGVLEIDGSGGGFGFEDPVAARMLDAGLRELSSAERTRTYRRVERRILTQAPLVPLYHTLGVVATRTHVHGFEPGPMGVANLELENVWIEPGAVARLQGGGE
jgi:peptide/nickel transport system substrate-binding protein